MVCCYHNWSSALLPDTLARLPVAGLDQLNFQGARSSQGSRSEGVEVHMFKRQAGRAGTVATGTAGAAAVTAAAAEPELAASATVMVVLTP